MKKIYQKQRIIKAVVEIGSSPLGIPKEKLAGKFEDESANLFKKLRTDKGDLKHLAWRLKFYLDVRISDDDVANIKTVGNLLETFASAINEEEWFTEMCKSIV